MPRGDNPNSRANLKPLEKGLPKEDQRKTQLKGARKGVEVRQANASLTEAMKEAVTPEVAEQLVDIIIKRAKQGNLKAFELVRDQLGEKPVEKVEQTSTNIVIDFGDIEGDE